MVEDQTAPWYQSLAQHKLGSTIPVLRLLIQQSNCFVIVERGLAMQNMNTERALQQTGEMRADGNFGKGQMVAADYTMSPMITFSQNTGGAGGALGGLTKKHGVLGALMGNIKTNEASTMLIMIDNRSGVQLAAAEGSAKRSDLDFGAALLGPIGAAGATSYSKSPQGKIIISAFTDSYNQLVRAVRNYKAQTVQGGLGNGGTLGVQGGSTAASVEVEAAGVRKPVAAK
ncbi:hypothetical protein BH11PSE8_BH11PSE8_47310 [soil metagenome]